jgi:hypothetical protein
MGLPHEAHILTEIWHSQSYAAGDCKAPYSESKPDGA